MLAEKKFFSSNELLKFCHFDSILGGHPESFKVRGVEASTGALGHGLGIGVGIYLIPTIIAFARKVPSTLSVAVLNIFLGWSIIGFVVALVWALKNYDYVPPDLRNKDR